MNLERWDELAERMLKAVESPEAATEAQESGDSELLQLIDWHNQALHFLEPRPARTNSGPEDPWIGREIQSRYRLEGVLGRGGAGVVFRASDRRLGGQAVAMKLLHDFWSTEEWMRRRFKEEAAILASLDHAGIVNLLDAGESEEGRLFLVLPFHEGRTLRDALSWGPLESSLVGRLLREVGEAVSYAHSKGVLHRDLKPENILLVRRADGEHPLLIDFGIAHLGEGTAPCRTTTHLMGSPAYMAPEHLLGKAVPASDTYSLGVIAWEMLAGVRPFDSVAPFALPEQQRKGLGDRFYRLRPDLSVKVGKELLRALDFDPRRRPYPPKVFTEALAGALVEGAVDSPWARWWVLRSSRRWALTGIGAAMAGSVAGEWLWRNYLSALPLGERVIELPRGASAEMTGFRLHREVTERAVRDASGRVVAMRLLSPDQGQVHMPLSLHQKRAAFRRGWRASALCRPESGGCGLGLETGHFAPRFDFGFQVSAGGVELIATQRVRTGWDGIRRPVTLPGAPALVRMEMIYDARRASATIALDGRRVVEDYKGHTEYRDDLGVFFGVHSVNGLEGSTIFGGLYFEIFG
jgi:hypothetical protein